GHPAPGQIDHRFREIDAGHSPALTIERLDETTAAHPGLEHTAGLVWEQPQRRLEPRVHETAAVPGIVVRAVVALGQRVPGNRRCGDQGTTSRSARAKSVRPYGTRPPRATRRASSSSSPRPRVAFAPVSTRGIPHDASVGASGRLPMAAAARDGTAFA